MPQKLRVGEIMSLNKRESIGRVKSAYRAKLAEVSPPADNIPTYQDSPNDNGDLLIYAEPWGGAQNRPYADVSTPNALEQDPAMVLQGTQPQTFQNIQVPEEQPVSITNVIGEQSAYTKDPSSGDGAAPVGDSVQTKPSGSEVSQVQVDPIVTNFPYDEEGDNEEQTTSDMPYKYASSISYSSEGTSVTPTVKESIGRIVKASQANGSAYRDNPYRFKVASLEDMYSFERVSSSDLVHKSSRELWSIAVSPDGCTVVEKQFDDSGAPVRI